MNTLRRTTMKRNWQSGAAAAPTHIFAQQLRAECGVSAQAHDFEEWLGKVESLSGNPASVFSMLLSDAALHAFEEGVSAVEFALLLQARAA